MPRLGKEKDNLSVENETLGVSKKDITGLPMHPLRPKRSAKGTRKLREHIEEQLTAFAIHTGPKISGWGMGEVAEFQHFCTEMRRNRTMRTDIFAVRAVFVAGGRMVAP